MTSPPKLTSHLVQRLPQARERPAFRQLQEPVRLLASFPFFPEFGADRGRVCRGIGLLAQRSLDQYGAQTHLICSSGGNAGLACAYAAWSLGVKSTIMVPLTTKQPMVDRLRGFGSEVVQGGNHWAEADEKARALVARTTGGYVRPAPFRVLLCFELG